MVGSRLSSELSFFSPLVTIISLCLAGCDNEPSNPREILLITDKSDTGWQADTSYELGGKIQGRIVRPLTDAYADLEKNPEQQEELIDWQLKYLKTSLEKKGYRLNLLAEKVLVNNVIIKDQEATINYEAQVDLIGAKNSHAAVPRLADISPRAFSIKAPLNPVDVYTRNGDSCIRPGPDSHVANYNHYYFFDAEKPGCAEPMHNVSLEIEKVYPINETYPEYDKLMLTQEDNARADNARADDAQEDDAQEDATQEDDKTENSLAVHRLGFSAALIVNYGDNDALDRFNLHRQMLEKGLNLVGEGTADNPFIRYRWNKGAIRITIDLYDPTRADINETFASALGKYQVVFYNGHANYGNHPFLRERKHYAPQYQIIMMHACQTYAYYARQVFNAKATEKDPNGFALADVVASGVSTSPLDSPRTLQPLLQNLMDGLVAIKAGHPQDAPTWSSIISQMNAQTSTKLYGVAGVRDNAWQPR